jgi:deoxyhypusine synthase
MTWGKVDPEQLPGTVVCYADSTIALPILTAYALASAPARPLKRLYDRRDELLGQLRDDYLASLNEGDGPTPAADAAAGAAVGRATPHPEGEGER